MALLLAIGVAFAREPVELAGTFTRPVATTISPATEHVGRLIILMNDCSAAFIKGEYLIGCALKIVYGTESDISVFIVEHEFSVTNSLVIEYAVKTADAGFAFGSVRGIGEVMAVD